MRSLIAGLLILLPAAAQERYIARVSAASSSAPLTPVQSLVSGLANLLGLGVLDSIVGSGPANLYLISIPSGDSHDAALSILASDPAVLNLDPDVPLALPEVLGTRSGSASTPAPPGIFPPMVNYYNSSAWTGYVNQPAVNALNITAAHSFATGVGTVAFLDTGVDFSHPVLAPSLVSGWDFTNNSPGGSDSSCCQIDDSTTAILDDSTTSILDGGWTSLLNFSLSQLLGLLPPKAYGHGTMVAGLIHLAAPTAQLMPVRVFNSNGTTTLFRIVQGIYYAVQHGARVINMSFSSLTASTELAAAINYATSEGVILVSSVGNGGAQITVYPAAFPQVIGVASTDDSGIRSLFSNYGSPPVTLAAPGEAVVTLYPGNAYAVGWGTSFSAPLVAGGVALLDQLDSSDSEARALRAFSNASHPAQDLGLGLVDLYGACLYRATHSIDQ
jgi:subtilisin family serine protease